MFIIILGLLCWLYLAYQSYGKSNVPRNIRGGGGDDEPPPAPLYQQPYWAAGLPEEQLALIRRFAGQSLQTPGQFGQATDALTKLLNTQPQQFQFPMEAIQKALAAQQASQLQDYQRQIRPVLAQQGQLDSSAYTNLLDRYLQGQQTQSLGNTANLLTQQATQNFDLSKWLPQFQAGVAGQLAGVGSQQANINNVNNQIPLQASNALGGIYGQGLQLGDRNYTAANQAWQQAMQQYEQDQQNQSGMFGALGTLGGAGLGALFALPTGGLSLGAGALLGGSLGGAASPLWGGSGAAISPSTALQFAFPQPAFDLNSLFSGSNMGSTLYNPNWSNQSNILGFNTKGYR